MKKKAKKRLDEAIDDSVKKEMAKPRMAKSAREEVLKAIRCADHAGQRAKAIALFAAKQPDKHPADCVSQS